MYVSGTASATRFPPMCHLHRAGALLALPQRRAVALGQQLDRLGADVVARARVLVARIPEPDHEQIGGRTRTRRATRPPQPHDELLAAVATLGRRSARLALGALGGFALFALDALALDLFLDHDARCRDLGDDRLGVELGGDGVGDLDVGRAALVADDHAPPRRPRRRRGCSRASPRP